MILDAYDLVSKNIVLPVLYFNDTYFTYSDYIDMSSDFLNPYYRVVVDYIFSKESNKLTFSLNTEFLDNIEISSMTGSIGGITLELSNSIYPIDRAMYARFKLAGKEPSSLEFKNMFLSTGKEDLEFFKITSIDSSLFSKVKNFKVQKDFSGTFDLLFSLNKQNKLDFISDFSDTEIESLGMLRLFKLLVTNLKIDKVKLDTEFAKYDFKLLESIGDS